MMAKWRSERTIFGSWWWRRWGGTAFAWGIAAAGTAWVHLSPGPGAALADEPRPTTPSQSASPVDRARVKGALDKLTRSVRSFKGKVGVAVVDVGSGEVVAEHDADVAMNPASNAKLFTAAAALDRLGPDHRFVTGLYGRRQGSRVDPLVVRGQGDPSLEMAELHELARDLRLAGIRSVGAIEVDQSYFDDDYVPPAFDQQPNEWAPFRAPVAAVSVNENTVTFTFRATKSGEAAVVTVDPPGFVEVTGKVETSDEKSAENIQLTLSGSPDGRLTAKVGGRLPEGSRLAQFAKRVEDPRLLAGYALRQALLSEEVEVDGEVSRGGEDEKRLLTRHRSEPLGRLVWALGKDSDNFVAEMLFKAVGAHASGPSAEDASREVMAFLRERDIPAAGLELKNGSGLFDANRVSARATATLLRAVHLDPRLRPEFVAQLAIGGRDGTLASRLKKWGPSHTVRAKTGTLASVVSLSGYVEGRPGRPVLAFSVLVNGAGGKISDAREAVDAFVAELARQVERDRDP
jgi:D-alanyl-D-alanine carboxypeptidase/D-alanyl-D-alanine-endopeptidase (penicillin-binding protein 4)